MVLMFLSDFLDLYIRPILFSLLSEIKFQSLKAEHLLPEETSLNAKILVQLLLHLQLYLPDL